MNWTLLLYILGAALLIWLGYRAVKGNPHAFSKANLSKSLTTVWFLAMFLLIVVVIAILLLRM